MARAPVPVAAESVRRLALIAAVAICVPSAIAQDGVYDAMIQGATDNQITIANGIINADRMRKATARYRGQSTAASEPTRARPSATQASAAGASSYRESAAVRTQITTAMAKASEQRSPGTGEEMRRMVTSGTAMAQYRKVAAAYRFSATDAVDALAFYLIVQWGVANDHRPDVTRAQIAGVRNQVRSAFPSIAGQLDSDAKRQSFAETLAIQATIMAGVHEAAVAANASDRLAEYSAMARKGGTPLFGADPTGFELTDRGIVRRGG